MYKLNLRVWDKEENKMVYADRFSAMEHKEDNTVSVRVFIEKQKKIDSYDYMLRTPGNAINGEIYEQDIVRSLENIDSIGIAEFSPKKAGFIVHLKEKDIFLAGDLDFEIIGNSYENPELLEKCYGVIQKNILKKSKENEPVTSPLNIKVENKKETKENKIVSSSQDVEIKNKKEETENIKKNPAFTTQRDKTEENKENKDKEFKPKNMYSLQNFEKENENKKNIVPFIQNAEKKKENITDTKQDNKQDNEKKTPKQKSFDDVLNETEKPEIKIYFKYEFYTDFNIGKYGYLMIMKNLKKLKENQIQDTTKDRAQLLMLIDALASLKKQTKVTIISNEQYLLYPFINKWVQNWEKDNWIKSTNNQEIKNRDLWEKLYNLSNEHIVSWQYEPNLEHLPEYKIIEKEFNK